MSKNNSNPLAYLFGSTWKYSEGNRKNVVRYWIMFIVAQTSMLTCFPLIMRKIVAIYQTEGVTRANITHIWMLLISLLLTQILSWSFHGPARLIERTNAFKARSNYRKYLLKGVMTLPMEWHADNHSGEIIDKMEKGANGLFDFSANSFEIIYNIIQFVVSYGMMIYFSPSSKYIVLTMTVIIIVILTQFDKVLVRQYRILNRTENTISESVFDAVSNINTVIILRVERLVFEAIARKIDEPFELYKKNIFLNELKWFLMNILCTVMIVLVLGVYVSQHLNVPLNLLVVADFFILIQYLDKIKVTFDRCASMYGDILIRRAKVTNAEELSTDFRSENFTNHVLPSQWQKLEIAHLNFSYHTEGTSDLHLEDISLSLTRGERIAFVGESGSGKTTLLKVMRDLYHPRSLTLSVDGQLLPQGFEGISRAIALVPQNPEIFATTILENITLGAEYDLEFVRRFTDMACCTEVVESLPKQFESSIKEKGVNLSGGQQQRLALSRGFLACNDKDIVLLDEPTSSLDTTNEMRVYQNIFREFRGKTIISSIHRLHLLPLFDSICIFDGGRIVARGTLDELLSSCSQFQTLWRRYTEHQQNEKLAL